MNQKVIALILGGGVGSRLYPLTKHQSKPAVPVGGKYRLVDIPISNCLNAGLKRMFVLTQFNSASLNQHIKNTYRFDIFNGGFVEILAAEQTPSNKDWFQGTADAVRQSMHHLAAHDYDHVMILSGDQLYQMDFNQMLQHHISTNAELTIATIPVAAKDASAFGIMKVDEQSRIKSFIEKPARNKLLHWKSKVKETQAAAGKYYLASMGIYIFKKKTLMQLFDKSPKAIDFGKEIIPFAIAKDDRVFSYQYDGYWTDIGHIKSYFEANLALTDRFPKFNLFDKNRFIYTRPRILAPSKIFGTFCDRALIAEGGIIFAQKITRSVIGLQSRIGENTILKNTIVLGNDYLQNFQKPDDRAVIPIGIGDNCYLENVIVEKNCRIGNNVFIKGSTLLREMETEQYCVRSGIVVIKKGAVIPDYTLIGRKEILELNISYEEVGLGVRG